MTFNFKEVDYCGAIFPFLDVGHDFSLAPMICCLISPPPSSDPEGYSRRYITGCVCFLPINTPPESLAPNAFRQSLSDQQLLKLPKSWRNHLKFCWPSPWWLCWSLWSAQVARDEVTNLSNFSKNRFECNCTQLCGLPVKFVELASTLIHSWNLFTSWNGMKEKNSLHPIHWCIFLFLQNVVSSDYELTRKGRLKGL